MRRRPSVTVVLEPVTPRAGSALNVDVLIGCRAETPCDGIEVALTGRERRFSHMDTTQYVPTSVSETHEIVALIWTSAARDLSPGEHRFGVDFALPKELPPSYKSPVGSIAYELFVRVHIPWWPDRRERFEVQVRPPRRAASASKAVIFASHPDGPPDGEPGMEATLASPMFSVGATIDGAVALTNVHPRTRRLEASLVAIDRATFRSARREVEVRRLAWTVFDGAPPEGTAVPFSIQLPSDLAPTFRARLFELTWRLELKAVVGMQSDLVLRAPISLVARGSKKGARARTRKLPPIGRARRERGWAEIAARRGFIHDAEAETLEMRVGSVEVRIEIEPRAVGLSAVATLTWPSIGLALHVTERRWTDRFAGSLFKIEDVEFVHRFAVRGREAEQARSFLVPAVRGAMLRVEQLHLGDDGAELASSVGADVPSAVDAFARDVLAVARAVDGALAGVAPPSSMRDSLPAYRAFAERTGARLEVGSMSLHHALVDGVAFDLVTRFDDARSPARPRSSTPSTPSASASSRRPRSSPTRARLARRSRAPTSASPRRSRRPSRIRAPPNRS